MASVTVTLANRCSGGNHVRFELTGAKTATVREELPNVLEPITDDEVVVFVKCIVKLCKSDKNNAQTLAALQSGVTITV